MINISKKPIFIFGVRYAGPRGLRKSPKTNWLAACVGRGMRGKHGDRGAIKSAFNAVAKECAKTHGGAF